jgi:hypothetical protein
MGLGIAWEMTVKGELAMTDMLIMGERQSCRWEGVIRERDLLLFKIFRRLYCMYLAMDGPWAEFVLNFSVLIGFRALPRCSKLSFYT